MNNGRWYPYNVTINTGEPVIMAGNYWTNEPTLIQPIRSEWTVACEQDIAH